VGETICCLYIAALSSVIVSNLGALLNITAQSSAISISWGKRESKLRNRGMVFRYSAVYAAFRVHNIRRFRYLMDMRSREPNKGGKSSPSMRGMYFGMLVLPQFLYLRR
jgi:hypothetical protein